MENNNLKQISVEVNVIYMMSLAMDLIIRDIDWRMLKNREMFKHEKKQMFTRFTKTVRDACIIQEMITQDIFEADEKHNFKNVQIWQEEANELSRLMLMYADRSASEEVVNEIFSYIRTLPSEGIVDEKMLDAFRLKKI